MKKTDFIDFVYSILADYLAIQNIVLSIPFTG